MSKPLNGCLCQDGSCESCNRLSEAFEAMREALLGIAIECEEEVRDDITCIREKNWATAARQSLALADKAVTR